MRWMMLMMLGACAVDGEPLDTADPEPPPLECPEGERYHLIGRLCGGIAMSTEGEDDWRLRRHGQCSFNDPRTDWGLRIHPDRAEWWRAARDPEREPDTLVTTLAWHIEPAAGPLPERLVLQGTEVGKPWHCPNDAVPAALLIREEGY